MNQISVEFLENQFVFPKEVKDYVFYSKRIQESGAMFFEKLTERIEKKWYDYPDDEFENLLKNEGKCIIQILSEDNIYDVTLSELLNRNSGYKFFKEFTDAGFDEWKNIAVQRTEEYIAGLKNAQFMADSQVTGSGVSLYSSSFLAHMTFMALESNTIKKQERQAEKVYRNAIDSLEKTGQAKEERKKNEFLYKCLYPAYGKMVTMFLDDMLDVYLEILQEHSVYEYSNLKVFDVEKSMEILENLSVIDNKKQVLINAFRNCPYNIRVYEEVVNCGLMDCNTFETAKTFDKDTEIISYIKEYCIEHLKEKNIVMKYIDIIASYEKVDCNTVLNQLYQEEVVKIKEEYRNLRILLENPPILKRRIESKLSLIQNNSITLSKEDIQGKIYDFIDQIDSEKVSAFLDYGIISYGEINMYSDTLESLDEINLKYKKCLLEKILQYLEEIKKEKREEEEKAERERIEKEEAELEELKRQKNERWLGSVTATISSILLSYLLFVPGTIYVIMTSLISQCILLIISILSVRKKITQKTIGVVFGWIGCFVSGLNIIFVVITILGFIFGII